MKQKPLLMEELSPNEQASLTSLMQQPGWLVLEKLHFEAVSRATADVLKQNPAEPGYTTDKVVALQQRARERQEFSLLILGSVEYHAQALSVQINEQKQQPQENPILKGMNKK